MITTSQQSSSPHITHRLMMPFQKFRFSFSLSNQSQAIRVSPSFTFRRSNYQYRLLSFRTVCAQNISWTARMGLLFLMGSYRGTGESISMQPALSLLVERGGQPCRLNSEWMVLLVSMTARRVVILSFSYRKRFLMRVRNISMSLLVLLESRKTISCKLLKAPNYVRSQEDSLLADSQSERWRLMRDYNVAKVLAMSEQDLMRRSQLPKRVSSCRRRRQYCTSISPMREQEAMASLSAGAVGGMVMVLLVRTTSPKNLGLGTAQQASSFFLNSSLEYSFLVSPQKNLTTSLILSSSLLTITKRMNSSTIHLYLERVSGSLPSELPSHPSASRKGSLRKGKSRCRMARSLSRSAYLRWMVIWQGVKVMWQRVQSPCRKLRVTCSVLLMTTSWMLGRGCKGFSFAVVSTTLERLIAAADSPFLSLFFSTRTCYFMEMSLIVASRIGRSFDSTFSSAGKEAGGSVGFCMMLGGESGESLEAGSTCSCTGSCRPNAKSKFSSGFG